MSAPKPTNLDAFQVLRGAFDEETGRLRTDTQINIESAQVNVDLHPSTDGVHLADSETGSKLSVNTDGSINVTVRNSTFPEIANILLNTPNEEYYYPLPENTKKLIIKARKGTIRLSFYSNGTNSEYLTIPRGCTYTVEDINYTGNVFFRSNKENDILEIICWF